MYLELSLAKFAFLQSSLINDFFEAYLWLVIVLGCLVFALGILLGYFFGNISLRKFYIAELDAAERLGSVQRSIAENVGLGIIVYDKQGPIYANSVIENLKFFLDDGIPKTFDNFLDKYDKDNHLKSDYILSLENGNDEIRSNYTVSNKIYEIKILKRDIEYVDEKSEQGGQTETLRIVLIDDITQLMDDERRQRDLAANISHELRTPLTVIRGSEDFVRRLNTKDRRPSDDEITAWGNRVLANAIRMNDLVEDFLTLSNTRKQNFGIFDLNVLVRKGITNLSGYTNADQVKIIPPQNDAYPLCFGNSKNVLRTINNLLTNAVKYIDYEGKTEGHLIRVNIVTTDDRIGVQVADNGMGIPKKDIPYLFDRFYRVDNSGARDVGGSGLGLAIVNEIAELHDGSVNVVSDVGLGSTFTLFLPRAKTAFERVYEDAKTEVLSDVDYYRHVMDFLLREEMEVAMSRGYDDIVKLKDTYKIDMSNPKLTDKEKVNILRALGDERFEDLVDELTYVDFVEDDEEDDGYEGEYYEDEELYDDDYVKAQEAAVQYAEEALDIYEDTINTDDNVGVEATETIDSELKESEETDLERLKKKEVQEFLRQPVVQQSVKKATESQESQSLVSIVDKEAPQIHPNVDNRLYNSNGAKFFATKRKTGKTGKTSKTKKSVDKTVNDIKTVGESEPIRSAVRQVLDEATIMDSKIVKNNDNEG